jgi:hypothetical protein
MNDQQRLQTSVPVQHVRTLQVEEEEEQLYSVE